MDIRFKDSTRAERENRVCCILASLCQMVETGDRMASCNGSLRRLYQDELAYYYKSAIFDTLQLLGQLTHSNIGYFMNAERLCVGGHKAFEELISEYADYLDAEVSHN